MKEKKDNVSSPPKNWFPLSLSLSLYCTKKKGRSSAGREAPSISPLTEPEEKEALPYIEEEYPR